MLYVEQGWFSQYCDYSTCCLAEEYLIPSSGKRLSLPQGFQPGTEASPAVDRKGTEVPFPVIKVAAA